MTKRSQPCPFYELCGGMIQIWPEVDTDFRITNFNETQCITSVAVTVTITAQCDACSFHEILDINTQELTFDQFFHTTSDLQSDQIEVLEELYQTTHELEA